MTGWTIEACGCGFSLGDRHDEFPTRQEAESFLVGLNETDFTPRGATAPDGKFWTFDWKSDRLQEPTS